jgi:hypothetical protein
MVGGKQLIFIFATPLPASLARGEVSGIGEFPPKGGRKGESD